MPGAAAKWAFAAVRSYRYTISMIPLAPLSPSQILFEDNHVLAINKPAPLLTQAPAQIPSLEAMVKAYIKDKHAKHLLEQSREVNQVWNYCQETSLKILARERRFCTGYDLDQLTAGATKEGLSLHSQTLQAVSAEYCTRRRQFKKVKLR